jgi:hypothetical protein
MIVLAAILILRAAVDGLIDPRRSRRPCRASR